MSALVVALTATGGNAVAADTPGIDWDHTYSYTGVRVYVEERGDIISVCDTKKNGHSAFVEVISDGVWPYDYEMRATGGYGSCKIHRASDGAKYDLDEGDGVALVFSGVPGGPYGDYAEAYFKNDH
ncbi:hypothetical protein ACIQPS_36135 [Streptomyces sp. NPDC091290]|uniref:hypothetical protein n=1 Tax=Streptomyces sp. NPDC091290 TaxID=3365990 RepID=UPI003825956A